MSINNDIDEIAAAGKHFAKNDTIYSLVTETIDKISVA